MPTYIHLLRFTDKGIMEIRDTLNRAKKAEKLADDLGGDLKEVYWTVGPYDLVTLAEFPDDETSTAYSLALGSLGAVRTTTLLAFDRHEIAGVLHKIPPATA